MAFSLCASSEGLHSSTYANVPPVPKSFRKATKKDNVHVAPRRRMITCHLMPRHMEGSVVGGRKELEEPGKKLDFVRTLLIDNYDSYTYNIYQELSVVNGLPPVVIRNDDWTWRDIWRQLYKENAFDNIVISPGPGSPTCASDIGICLKLLLDCGDIPILGVCLGHQALGYVHGAQIIHASEPVHGRLSEIEHNGCRLFHEIPSGRNSGFKVVRYHSLVIDAESLPKEIIPIAWTSSTDTRSFMMKLPNGSSRPVNYSGDIEKNKVLMGIMHSTRPHYGVQFHPESIATCHGSQLFKNFRNITEDFWLRSRSSAIHASENSYVGFLVILSERKIFLACMQVPSTNLSFRVSRIPDLVKSKDNELLVKQASRCKKNVNHVGSAKKLRLRWKKCGHLVSEVGGAKNIFRQLFGDHGAENTFWLDSSSIEKLHNQEEPGQLFSKRGRFSFMGGPGGSLWKQLTYKLFDKRLSHEMELHARGLLSIENAHGSTETIYLQEGFLDHLNKELLLYRCEEKDFKGLPFDFYGGYVGYIGYNLKVECGMSSNRHKSNTPDACLFFADNFIVIDDWSGDIYILSVHEENTTITPWLENTEQKLLKLKVSTPSTLKEQTLQTSSSRTCKEGFTPEKSREQYKKDVEKCLQYIKDGESYELCLTNQLRRKVEKVDSLGLYLHLREKNPAPYAAWLKFSNESLCICCSSPERFLRLDRNGMLEAKPIKGTISRGKTREEDEELKSRLQYSEKDQAENLMIVDLLRNDLGRVCEPGSVHVPKLMDVESYATVHTMVSTIRGKKRSNLSAVDCVKAAFPGGSMTGAPKLRSMELLDSIENSARGIYSGCIGYFSYNQTFDLNIVIRTVVIHKEEASIGAGGAIVALSNPEDEYEEMILKTRAPSNAVMEFQ
ncbi:hypothetical protein ACFE04_027609 [Oxalis oulophora]